ncbi:excalibur calcium-binding domain-containing protein [Nonomuraea sp. NPDC003804]|uniref:excalibur calcium-binding domain-containing protein n=1 Tax=Nonomuraea sp. NPDC003804 TaxID=3154547 RepID=UPI0033BC1BBC
MEKPPPPGRPPGAQPAAVPEGPKASRLTTIVLIVSLVLVVLTAGVLGTVAVLMTRNPDSPLFGGKPPIRLGEPIYFAPVEDQKASPCPGQKVALSQDGKICYFLSEAVPVSAVQAIETVKEKDSYGVRIAVAPAFRDALAALMKERVDQQIAILVGQNETATVLAAPTVAQQMSGDSVSIAGFTKDKADALVKAMLGAAVTPTPPQPGVPGTSTTPQPGTTPGTTPQPGTTPPGTQPGATPPGTQPGATPPGTQPGTTGTGTTPPGAQPGTTQPGTGQSGVRTTATASPGAGLGTSADASRSTRSSLDAGTEKRYSTCKEARAAGYGGPYQKGRHPQYYWYTDKDGDGFACDPQDG